MLYPIIVTILIIGTIRDYRKNEVKYTFKLFLKDLYGLIIFTAAFYLVEQWGEGIWW